MKPDSPLAASGARLERNPVETSTPQHLGQRLLRALDRQVLGVHEVAGDGSDVRAVAGRGSRLGGKRRRRQRPAGTAPLVDPVLGRDQRRRRHVEDLADLDGLDRSARHVFAAVSAALDVVDDDLVGIFTACQVLTVGVGLLAPAALLLLRRTLLSTALGS